MNPRLFYYWLYPDELQLISQLNPKFSGFGISSMSLDDKFITGLPHGGGGGGGDWNTVGKIPFTNHKHY